MTPSPKDALSFSAVPKMEVHLTRQLKTKADLSLAYTPGIAQVSQLIQKQPEKIFTHSFRRNNLAIISDGSAVLGLGNIGPQAAYPVMEGKAMLFKQFGHIDAIPLVIDTQDENEFISTVTHLAGSFAAINLEDISAPRCFTIEQALIKALSIPVMHDDQHGTAIVVLAALKNALTLFPKQGKDTCIVLSGAGAAGIAIANMLISAGYTRLTLVDSQGIINRHRQNLTENKQKVLNATKPCQEVGNLQMALKGADVFIGVSQPHVFKPEFIQTMSKDPIIFAMANPTPEIMPDSAIKAGAALVATGRSDFPNQINNALAFPGIFRGAIDARSRITEKMKFAASSAIVNYHQSHVSPTQILPSILDLHIHHFIAKAVNQAV